MVSDKSKEQVAGDISEVVLKYRLSPSEFRHISKRVREKCNLQIPKVSKSLPDFLNPAEIYRLFEVSKNNPFDGLLIEFMIFTGLRLSETKNLLIGNIDFYNNQLKVIQGKGHKDRFIPVSLNLQSKIKLFLHGRNKGYVFCRSDEKVYTARALRYRISKQIIKCNFSKRIHTHSLRHTFACLCLARGLRLEDIKLLMGHDNIKTTEIYAKLELGSIKDQFLQLMNGL